MDSVSAFAEMTGRKYVGRGFISGAGFGFHRFLPTQE